MGKWLNCTGKQQGIITVYVNHAMLWPLVSMWDGQFKNPRTDSIDDKWLLSVISAETVEGFSGNWTLKT